MDYGLASRQLFGRVTEVQHINPSFSFSDHSGVRVKIMIETFPEGPGTFRANPYIEEDSIYDSSTTHLISQELLEMTSLGREEKIQETELNNKIFNLSLKMNRNEATEDEH